MKSLIIPMCGKSSRFPDLRPKWMLTHPISGDLMCVESIKGINLELFDNIYFTFLKKHEDDYKISHGLKKSLDSSLLNKVHLTILEDETSSQSETVYKTIINNCIDGFIFIKDSDSYFNLTNIDNFNQICYFNLNNIDNINARSKSYLSIDKNNIISNIVEKKVISPYFSVGGYAFISSQDFCNFFEKISSYPGESYISNVIFEMILDGQIFKGTETDQFIDWGTLKEWREYCNQFSTIFIDLDGTLITNTSHLIPPYIGEGKPLLKNIQTLRELHNNGRTKIVITTSRPDSYRDLTTQELQKFDIKYDQLIMGLPHAKRILINDFSKTNIYPTSISINIDRNSDTLNNFLS